MDDTMPMWKPYKTEDKIWFADSGKNMRYKVPDKEFLQILGKFKTENAPDRSVGELAADIISTALGESTNPEFRVAGHSLGNQVVMNMLFILKMRYESGLIENRNLFSLQDCST